LGSSEAAYQALLHEPNLKMWRKLTYLRLCGVV